MSNNSINLLQSIFWEFDLSFFDIKVYKRLIIERVLEKGKLNHIKWLFSNYTLEEIYKVVESSLNISPKSTRFWITYLNYEALQRGITF